MTDMEFTEENSTLGDRLAYAREAMDLTMDDVAKRLGVKKSTIKKWENDRSEPRSNRLYMLGGILNANVMWLMTGRGDEPSGAVEPAELDRSAIKVAVSDMKKQVAKLERNIEALEALI